MNPKPIWVLDTNVLLDWLIFSDHNAAPLGQWIESSRVRLITRRDCRDEFVRVLDYPALKADLAQREQALQTYDRWHLLLEEFSGPSPALTLPQCSDADDQKFLELALACGADWLITKDKALLKLSKPIQKLGQFRILDVIQASNNLASIR